MTHHNTRGDRVLLRRARTDAFGYATVSSNFTRDKPSQFSTTRKKFDDVDFNAIRTAIDKFTILKISAYVCNGYVNYSVSVTTTTIVLKFSETSVINQFLTPQTSHVVYL